MTRVLLYGDVDLNLIDGSSIWLASIAEVFGGVPDVSVTVLQKTPVTRDVVIRGAAALPHVRFLDPWLLAKDRPEIGILLSHSPARRLSAEAAAAIIARLDQDSSFDVLLIRSLETTATLADSPSLSTRIWAYVTDPMRYAPPAERAKLTWVASRCDRIVCQTDEAQGALTELLGQQIAAKLLVLPPMIPALASGSPPALDPAAPRLGYSGKLSPPYRILEMLDAFEKIRARIPGAEFHVVGDKFHNAPPVEGFIENVTRRLSSTPGVVWHGGVSRAEANALLARVHVASSWRSAAFDDSLEMSTKILEYSALGIPVLMNPSPIQRRVFGPDYPGYVTTEAGFIERFLNLTSSPGLYQRASKSVRATAASFTFESNRQRLLPLLRNGITTRVQPAHTVPTILWVGHDFKFLRQIKEAVERALGGRSLVDHHHGHVIQNPERSRQLLAQADLIFCEWCLGNAEWYSRHKRPDQRLIVRLHRQEIELEYLNRIEWKNVDRIIFIAEWVMERFLLMFPDMADRAVLIHNAIDCETLAAEKLHGAEFNLGLLGYCPKLKAPQLAVEILTHLKQRDRRYTLFIKGTSPEQLDWLWKRTDERRYYRELHASIDASPQANSVVFEPHNKDVGAWFSKIGFVLSTSDLEGSHQAVAEGMASGAIPVIRNWFGADRLYPPKYIFSTAAEAAELVRKWNTVRYYEPESAFCREWSREFDLPVIAGWYAELLTRLLSPNLEPCGTGARDTRAAFL